VSNNESNTQQAANGRATGELDWVIVDRSEEADKLNKSIGTSTSANIMDVGVNTSIIVDNQMAYATNQTSAQNGAEQTLTEEHNEKKEDVNKVQQDEDESDEVLLGSFFERNEHTDGEEEEQMQQDEEDEVKQKDWLITPLPCLTSITTSQRSIVENHPFENLLIEHPSMSVFVSATSSNNQMKDDVIEEDDVTSAEVDIAPKIDEQSLAKVSKSVKRPSAAVVSNIKKSQSEKRKESSQQTVSETSPIQSLRKKGRKHRKSTSSTSSGTGSTSDLTSANKENMQVKSLLVQQCNKFGLSNQINKQFDCTHISKKNQLNRFNKIATFSSVKNVNNKHQRKFHKLQQPASYNFNQAQCY